mmetsp:Transcript_63049/g.117983  ORF Transcript_63049/g.117983 Transcript_63049/m.117983 type:complete len:206 (-) Transcript_63049:195-812(-)
MGAPSHGFMCFAGQAYDKGDQIWVNIGWNSEGNQRVPAEVPHLLAGSVEETTWRAFTSDLRAGLESKAIAIPRCLRCPCGFCVLCPYLCVKKIAFDAAMTRVTTKHKANLPGFVGWKLMRRARKQDVTSSLGYNLIFAKTDLPIRRRQEASLPVITAQVVGSAPAQEHMTLTHQVEEVKDLLDRGLITEKEFSKKKALILGISSE